MIVSLLWWTMCLCSTGRCQSKKGLAWLELTVTLIVEYGVKTNYIACVCGCHVAGGERGGYSCWHHPLQWQRTGWCVFGSRGFSSIKQAPTSFAEKGPRYSFWVGPPGFLNCHIADAASRGKCCLSSTHAFQSMLLSFWKQWRHDWHTSSSSERTVRDWLSQLQQQTPQLVSTRLSEDAVN